MRSLPAIASAFMLSGCLHAAVEAQTPGTARLSVPYAAPDDYLGGVKAPNVHAAAEVLAQRAITICAGGFTKNDSTELRGKQPYLVWQIICQP